MLGRSQRKGWGSERNSGRMCPLTSIISKHLIRIHHVQSFSYQNEEKRSFSSLVLFVPVSAGVLGPASLRFGCLRLSFLRVCEQVLNTTYRSSSHLALLILPVKWQHARL